MQKKVCVSRVVFFFSVFSEKKGRPERQRAWSRVPSPILCCPACPCTKSFSRALFAERKKIRDSFEKYRERERENGTESRGRRASQGVDLVPFFSGYPSVKIWGQRIKSKVLPVSGPLLAFVGTSGAPPLYLKKNINVIKSIHKG